jgi:hypothetical protein
MNVKAACFAASAAFALASAIALAPSAAAGERELFISSALEHPDNTATLPLYRGTSRGQTVWYVILDASDGNEAERLGVNKAQKLANARGTAAVQKVTVNNGVIEFPRTVDFTPVHNVVPGNPLIAEPGSVGEDGYSPLIQLPNGVVLNAPHVAVGNADELHRHDKVVRIDTAGGKVTLKQTDGFQGARAVKYISTDASEPDVAALEGSTHAPALKAAPFAGGDGTSSARASLAAFFNGQVGADNPQRQGINSALNGDGDPLNVLFWNPKQGRYSPLWDVFPTLWSAKAVAAGRNLRQTDFGQVENLADHGMVMRLDGAPFGAADIVVNCPIVSRD